MANAEYLSSEDSVRFVGEGHATSLNTQQWMSQERRGRCCKQRLVFTLLFSLLLILLLPTVVFIFLRNNEEGYATSSDALPDVTNVKVADVGVGFFTATWDRPDGKFDYYWLNVTGGSDGENILAQSQAKGSCSSGKILHSSQTRVTCDHLQPCTKVSFMLRTHRNGPVERTSDGAMLQDIFIPGNGLDSPYNISLVGESPLLSRLLWSGPRKWSGILGTYEVRVCDTFDKCNGAAEDITCTDYTTPETWLKFDSTIDTVYCVLITARSVCGNFVVKSPSAAAEVRTPAFRPPDVNNARVTAVGSDAFTLTWERPKGSFDYYWIHATEVDGSPLGRISSCSSRTFLPPQSTHLSCDNMKGCHYYNVTIYTIDNGPPERISPGVTMRGILIPGKEPSSPNDVTVTWKSSYVTRVQWEPPTAVSGTLGVYIVNVCHTLDIYNSTEDDTGCTDYETLNPWLEFESTTDTEYRVLVESSAQCGTNVLKSTPAAIQFRTPTFVPPGLTNITLEDIGVDSFTVHWERPEGHFDYYWVEVTDDVGGNGGIHRYRVDSCRNGTILHPDQTRLTCGNLEACSTASITMRTHSIGPPARTSSAVTLGDIFIPGKKPSDFKVHVQATSNTSAEIVVHVPPTKTCLVDKCDGDCRGNTGEADEKMYWFTCTNNGTEKWTALLTDIEPNSGYSCFVWLYNIHKGETMSSLQIIHFNTPQ